MPPHDPHVRDGNQPASKIERGMQPAASFFLRLRAGNLGPDWLISEAAHKQLQYKKALGELMAVMEFVKRV